MKNLLERIKSWFKTTDFKALVKKEIKNPIFWVRFSAYAIPLAFLLYVIYLNFLPFGYNKTFIINVGSQTDTNVGEFYLEPSKDLSERRVAPDGTTYRELNGTANVIFKPKAILKDATITVSVDGEGASLIPPVINFDPSSISWDYSWDFTKEIPKDLVGNAFVFDGATYFNGKDARLEFPSSTDKFEDGPFSVYVEWEPRDNENNAQQIAGHYNWELWQNKDSVQFQVGRMNNATGTMHIIKYPVTLEFFNKKHGAIVIYNPSENGYFEFFVDRNLAGRTYFNADKIWKDYGRENLSFGKSNHGVATYFKGTLYQANIISKNILLAQPSVEFEMKDLEKIELHLISELNVKLKTINVNVYNK